MLTRIELDGFKTFADFKLTLRPFHVILGTNASGKSNLFDAIQLLARLASSTDVRQALKGLRGEPHELFRRQPDGQPVDKMTLAVEVLLNPTVQDPYGDAVSLTQTRLRYEVTLERRRDARGIERILVESEQAMPLRSTADSWIDEIGGASKGFKQAYLHYERRGGPYLETRHDQQPTFLVAQDGQQGRKRELPAHAAEATVLSSVRTAKEFPHLFALGAELRSWRILQLDPAALRDESDVNSPDDLLPNGANLPTVLHRIQAETSDDERPQGILPDIRADLSELITGLTGLSVQEDEQTRKHRLQLQMRGGQAFSARVASDGTLRMLALLTALYDPKRRGLICFEEPENGVHPARLRVLVKRLQELVTDPSSAGELEDSAPLTQILMNSHSPVVLDAGRESGGMYFSDIVTHVSSAGMQQRTRVRRVPSSKESLTLNQAQAPTEPLVWPAEVKRYLNTVEAES